MNAAAPAEALVRIRGLNVTFHGERSLPWRPARAVRAVREVDLDIAAAQTVGLVGESGSGKTTTGRALLGLLPIESGEVDVAGFAVQSFAKRAPDGYRRAVQAVFQDPVASLNPAMSVGQILAEPLAIHEQLSPAERVTRAGELLQAVGLNPHHLRRLPHEFSGGQRQRIAIARALATRPRLIVLDEPVSALDVSTQASVMRLLESLQSEYGVAYLLIAHDLAVVRHASERISVMYRGRIVEEGPADRVCEAPAHPYTQLLIASIPDPDPARQRDRRARRRALQASVDNRPGDSAPAHTADGCPFLDRCPHAMAMCASDFPAAHAVAGGGWAACHLHATDTMPAHDSSGGIT